MRSATTRRAVAEAYLDLVDGGDLRPTARAIATRAGVSERAVFRHFQDMETLHSEAAVLQIQRVAPELPEMAPTSGPVEERAALLALRWCTMSERVAPVRRVALLHEPFSTEIAKRLVWVRELGKAELKKTFAEELAAHDSAGRRLLIAALCTTLSWETWNEVRNRHGLDAEATQATIASMLVALLGSFRIA